MKLCGVAIRYFCGVLIKKDVSNKNKIDYTKVIKYSDKIIYESEDGSVNYNNKINYASVISY